jgi:hypothetical protein
MAGSFKKTRLITTGFLIHNAIKSTSKTTKQALCSLQQKQKLKPA